MEVTFSQGWTVDIHVEGSDLYLDWVATGSRDPHLTDILPWEARAFASALLQAAQLAEEGEPG